MERKKGMGEAERVVNGFNSRKLSGLKYVFVCHKFEMTL